MELEFRRARDRWADSRIDARRLLGFLCFVARAQAEGFLLVEQAAGTEER